MVGPDEEAHAGDGYRRVDHGFVSEERLPRKDRDDLADDAESRQQPERLCRLPCVKPLAYRFNLRANARLSLALK